MFASDLLDNLQVDCIDRLSVPVLCCTRTHTRNVFLFVRSGRVQVRSGAQVLYGAKEEVIFIPERSDVALRFFTLENEKPISLHEADINLEAIAFDATTHGIGLFSLLQRVAHVLPTGDVLENFATTLREEHAQERLAKRPMIKALMLQLCVFMLRCVSAAQDTFGLQKIELALRDPRFKNLCQYVFEHLHGDLSNRRLSSVSNVSEDYLGEYFRAKCDMTPQEYVEYQRLKHAVMLLRTTHTTVHGISKRAGFNDPSYFCRRFQKMFGQSALAVRRAWHFERPSCKDAQSSI